MEQRLFGISNNEVHLWYVHDQAIAIDSLPANSYNILSVKERVQQQKFRLAKHRHQYFITRLVLRNVLSKYITSIKADAWVFTNNQYGKPRITNAIAAASLDFNISHTDNMIVIAIVCNTTVGVDVERINRQAEILQLAERVFTTDEIAKLRITPLAAQRECFFKLWTLKESYIKARGMGMHIPLQQFGFDIIDNNISIKFLTDIIDNHNEWFFWSKKFNNLWQLALAVPKISMKIREFTWQPAISFAN